MTVIPLPVRAERRRTEGRPAGPLAEGRDVHRMPSRALAAPAGAAAAEAQAHISGTFMSPTGRVGLMTGGARVRHLHLEDGHMRATVVFAGRLCDADGSAIGTGSRRATAPAATAEGSHGRAVVIGPVEVDLLGLAVSVRPFVVGGSPPPGPEVASSGS